MIKHIKNNIKRSIIILGLAACLPACKDDFFDFPDRGGVDAAIWSTDGSVQLHLNRTYDVVIPTFPFQVTINERNGVHLASDENFFANTDQYTRAALGIQGELTNNDVRWAGNRYNNNNVAGENKYFDIQRCNEAIAYIPQGTMSQAKKNEYLGQYYALRAMTYFELVKVYGGVPLPLTPQTPENVYGDGRKSAKECFAAIISDLNNSITMLEGFNPDDNSGRGKITKLIATCLKAKVLFYWASPQFNPNNDASRWQEALAVNKEAYDLSIAAGKRLLTNYADIFRVEGTTNTEAILVRTHSATIERRGHDTEYKSRPASEGGGPYTGFMPSVKMLDAYPMRDGLPRGTSSAYPYDATMFWQNRDPRFDATIAYNGGPFALSGNANRRQWTYNNAISETNGNGVYCKRFTTPTLAVAGVRYTNNIGGNGMDWIELRLAEVMLNYADCLNETGDLAGAKNMVRQIRVRAGIVAGSGSNDYGLGPVTSMSAMRTLILNERMIEFAFENKRNSDLRRSRTMHLLNGTMQKMEINLVNSSDKAVLEAVTNGVMFRESLNTNDKATFTKYFRIVYTSISGYGPYAVPEFHYFYTFHNDFVNNGFNIQPTIGWSGGTFDPLN
ncbi:RagB/SusD family nutrient uptake outer membrane protein [Pedobacter sp. MW01-1-1]|uniref:RagB/SusD family nutrient uptake outer membrane protein n=1 Tax=Pedobacter sp. MW01-1-1 TaxID=3383027 RepID=UPI003FF13FD5